MSPIKGKMPPIKVCQSGSTRNRRRCLDKGRKAMSDEKLRALPSDVPDYHARQVAHLRALAANATTARLKARLLREAVRHEEEAEEVEALKAPAVPVP